MSSYFVTGATGFIGRHLVERLLEREGDVHVLVRESSRERLDALIERWGAGDRVKPVIGEHERDYLTKAINSAISRARLQVNALEVIGASLRHKQSTVLEARDWLKTEGLEPLVARYLKGGMA